MKQIRLSILATLFVISAVSGAWFYSYQEARALTPFLLIGGRSIITEVCTNPFGYAITVVGPRPGFFYVWPFPPATRSWWQFAGSWVLGKAYPGGECCVSKYCTPVEGSVHITPSVIGTSLF